MNWKVQRLNWRARLGTAGDDRQSAVHGVSFEQQFDRTDGNG